MSLIAILAAACGDDSGDPAAAAASGGSGGSGSGGGGSGGGGSGGGVTLEISGTPPSQVLAGLAFSYTPSVNNPDGVTLSFTATNLPSWATINPSTGQVTGTPTSANVGVYTGIRVTVSGGGASDTSPAFSVEVVEVATGNATLTWTPPTENTDGSMLSDLAGYKIYWGLTPSDLSNSVTLNNPGLTSYVVEELTPATWYFAAKSYNTDGVESAYSNVASKTIL